MCFSLFRFGPDRLYGCGSPPLDSDYADQRRSRTRTVVASDEKYGGMSRAPIFDRSRPRSHSAAPPDVDHHRLERTPSQRGRYSPPVLAQRLSFIISPLLHVHAVCRLFFK